MATAWQQKFGAASRACQVEVKKKVLDHKLEGRSLLKAIGACVKGKLKGKGTGSKKRRSSRKRRKGGKRR